MLRTKLKPLSRLTSSLVFFSSRRRHTRCLSDWSSDVCSSDLNGVITATSDASKKVTYGELVGGKKLSLALNPNAKRKDQIGRASCRERVVVSAVDVRMTYKNKEGSGERYHGGKTETSRRQQQQ